MSGIVNKTGAVSGVIGTTVGSVVLTGHVVQTTFTQYTTTTTTTGHSGTFESTGLTGIITPISTSNKLLVMVNLHVLTTTLPG